tara:strand:- start:951 stop:1403 length:453 start_codon:yes stop_codon:yes gene_type:complete
MSNNEINYIKEKFNGIFSSLNTFKLQITTLQQQVKILEKNVTKELNIANKMIEKNKNRAKRKPSGFAVKSIISEDLRIFMNIEKGEMCARTDVTKYLIKYIKENNLQKESDKRVIEPDEKLDSLLEVPEGETLTYFSLQKYMNRHFPKKN